MPVVSEPTLFQPADSEDDAQHAMGFIAGKMKPHGVVIYSVFPTRSRAAWFFNGRVGVEEVVVKVPLQKVNAMREAFAVLACVEKLKDNELEGIVPTASYVFEGELTCILMPLYQRSLADFPSLSEDEALKVVKTIRKALRTIHRHGWAHCDVKPHNIFVDSRNRFWLGDFGCCFPRSKRHRAALMELLKQGHGTPLYQCSDSTKSPSRIDRLGLTISVLEKLGYLQRPTSARSGQRVFTVKHVVDAINNKVKMAKLRDALLVLHAKDKFATSE